MSLDGPAPSVFPAFENQVTNARRVRLRRVALAERRVVF